MNSKVGTVTGRVFRCRYFTDVVSKNIPVIDATKPLLYVKKVKSIDTKPPVYKKVDLTKTIPKSNNKPITVKVNIVKAEAQIDSSKEDVNKVWRKQDTSSEVNVLQNGTKTRIKSNKSKYPSTDKNTAMNKFGASSAIFAPISISNIHTSLKEAFELKNVQRINDLYLFARKNEVLLNLTELEYVVWACKHKTLPVTAGKQPVYQIINPVDKIVRMEDVYHQIKAQNHEIPVVLLESMMHYCVQQEDVQLAEELYKDMIMLRLTEHVPLLGDYIIVTSRGLLKHGVTHDGMGVEKQIYQLFQNYARILQELKATPDGGVVEALQAHYPRVLEPFIEITRALSALGRQELTLDALKHLVESGVEPTLKLCTELWEHALVDTDVKTLNILANWFIHNFDTMILSEGSIIKMLHIGSGSGNSALVQQSIQLLRKCNYTLEGKYYAGWIHAAILEQDMPGMVEALIEAEVQGFNIANCPGVNASAIQEEIAIHISLSLRHIDELYYALVDLVRNNHHVPAIAVNSIIAGSGMSAQLDRAFATMSEYTSLFNLTPDVHTYNALLCAVARSPDKCFMKTLLSILERMEAENIVPNQHSYSLFIDAMVELSHYHILDDVLINMKAVGILPTDKSLRRLVIGLASNAAYVDKIPEIVRLLTREGSQNIPQFLQRRIDSITKHHGPSNTDNNDNNDRQSLSNKTVDGNV